MEEEDALSSKKKHGHRNDQICTIIHQPDRCETYLVNWWQKADVSKRWLLEHKPHQRVQKQQGLQHKQVKKQSSNSELQVRSCPANKWCFSTCRTPHSPAFAYKKDTVQTPFATTTITERNRNIAVSKIIPQKKSNIKSQKITGSRVYKCNSQIFAFRHNMSAGDALKEYRKAYMYSTRRLLKTNRQDLQTQVANMRINNRSASKVNLTETGPIQIAHVRTRKTLSKESLTESLKAQEPSIITPKKISSKSVLISPKVTITEPLQTEATNAEHQTTMLFTNPANQKPPKKFSEDNEEHAFKVSRRKLSAFSKQARNPNELAVDLKNSKWIIKRQPRARATLNVNVIHMSPAVIQSCSNENVREHVESTWEKSKTTDEVKTIPTVQAPDRKNRGNCQPLNSSMIALKKLTEESKKSFFNIQERIHGYTDPDHRNFNSKEDVRVQDEKAKELDSKKTKLASKTKDISEALLSGIKVTSLVNPRAAKSDDSLHVKLTSSRIDPRNTNSPTSETLSGEDGVKYEATNLKKSTTDGQKVPGNLTRSPTFDVLHLMKRDPALPLESVNALLEIQKSILEQTQTTKEKSNRYPHYPADTEDPYMNDVTDGVMETEIKPRGKTSTGTSHTNTEMRTEQYLRDNMARKSANMTIAESTASRSVATNRKSRKSNDFMNKKPIYKVQQLRNEDVSFAEKYREYLADVRYLKKDPDEKSSQKEVSLKGPQKKKSADRSRQEALSNTSSQTRMYRSISSYRKKKSQMIEQSQSIGLQRDPMATSDDANTFVEMRNSILKTSVTTTRKATRSVQKSKSPRRNLSKDNHSPAKRPLQKIINDRSHKLSPVRESRDPALSGWDSDSGRQDVGDSFRDTTRQRNLLPDSPGRYIFPPSPRLKKRNNALTQTINLLEEASKRLSSSSSPLEENSPRSPRKKQVVNKEKLKKNSAVENMAINERAGSTDQSFGSQREEKGTSTHSTGPDLPYFNRMHLMRTSQFLKREISMKKTCTSTKQTFQHSKKETMKTSVVHKKVTEKVSSRKGERIDVENIRLPKLTSRSQNEQYSPRTKKLIRDMYLQQTRNTTVVKQVYEVNEKSSRKSPRILEDLVGIDARKLLQTVSSAATSIKESVKKSLKME